MGRFIAVIILIIPGILGAYGIKLMRDALFMEIVIINATLQFILGLILFIAGLSFIGGFLFHRDKKRQLINQYKQQNKE